MKVFFISVFIFIPILFFSCNQFGKSSVNKLSAYYSPYLSEYPYTFIELIPTNEVSIGNGYNYIESQDTTTGDFKRRVFFPETKQVTEDITYVSAYYNVKNGPAKFWYDNGKVSSEGSYKDNVKDGIWYYYRWKDKAYSSCNYLDGGIDGEYVYYHEYGRERIYNYKNNKKEGGFVSYDTLGNITNLGVYHADTLFSETAILNSLKEQKFDFIAYLESCEEFPIHLRGDCSKRKILDYIALNITYPQQELDYNVQGKAWAYFEIDKDGNVVYLEIISGITQRIKNECLKVLKEMPKWKPGFQDGNAAKIFFRIPIRFTIF